MDNVIVTTEVVDTAGDIVVSTTSGTTTGTASTVVWPSWNKHWTLTTGGWIDESTSATASWGTSNCDRKSIKTWLSWVRKAQAMQATTASVMAAYDPWPRWVTNSTNAITSGGGGGSTVLLTGNAAIEASRPHISDEEYQARRREGQRQREEQERRWAAEQKERQAAKSRAQILLRENLTEAQKAELAEKRYFSLQVIDSETGERRNYRIHQGRARNVEQVDDNGRRLKTLCAHPAIDCPDEDTMLTQKLWLETREKEFLRVANHS